MPRYTVRVTRTLILTTRTTIQATTTEAVRDVDEMLARLQFLQRGDGDGGGEGALGQWLFLLK